MERCSRSKNPSFSSSLLDAIYRSMDDEHGDKSRRRAPDRSSNHKKQAEQPTVAPSTDHCHYRPSVTEYHRRSVPPTSSSSSSSCSSSASSTTPTAATTSSSSAGFSSSSDVESIRSGRIPRPDLLDPGKKKKKSKCGSIRTGLRSLRKSREPASATVAGSSPASPGARLASFLNALFASAGSPKKPKIPIPAAASVAAAAGGGGEDSACSSSTSSCRRSCLSKTPTAADRRRASGADAGKQSVRFYPVSVIVDEESQPCGHKRLQDDAGNTVAPVAARVEELLRAAGPEAEAEVEAEEEEGDGDGSESSSDLFELENLTVMMRGGRFRNELPVYETTDPSTNRAIAQGLIH